MKTAMERAHEALAAAHWDCLAAQTGTHGDLCQPIADAIEAAMRETSESTTNRSPVEASIAAMVEEAPTEIGELLGACWHAFTWSRQVADDWSCKHEIRMVAWWIRAWHEAAAAFRAKRAEEKKP